MVIDGWNASGDRDVEGDRAAVVLRHIGCNRIAADMRLCLEQAKIETIRVLIERPCGTQS